MFIYKGKLANTELSEPENAGKMRLQAMPKETAESMADKYPYPEGFMHKSTALAAWHSEAAKHSLAQGYMISQATFPHLMCPCILTQA